MQIIYTQKEKSCQTTNSLSEYLKKICALHFEYNVLLDDIVVIKLDYLVLFPQTDHKVFF